MGDVRFTPHYERVLDAEDPVAVIHSLKDEQVIEALAAATASHDNYLANVLATEAVNRLRRASATVDRLGAGVVAVDREGRVTAVNPAAASLLGTSQATFLGQDVHRALGCRCLREPSQEECPVALALRGAPPPDCEDGYVDRFDHRAVPVRFVITPLGEEGIVAGAIVAFQDVSNEKGKEARRAGCHAAQHTVAEALAESASLQEAAPRVLEAFGRSLSWDVGFLWLRSPATNAFHCAATWKAPGPGLDSFTRDALSRTFQLGEGIVGTVADTGGTLWVPDVAAEPSYLRLEAAQAAGLRTVIAFPFTEGRAVRGIVEFLSRTRREREPEIITVAEAIGGQFGVFSERSRWEASLSETLSLLGSTIESTTDGILVVDTAHRVTIHNEKFGRLWDLTPDLLASREDELLLQSVLSQIEDPEAFLDKVKNLYSKPEEESFDVIRLKDGRVFERYSQPQRVAGKVVGRVWSFRDVTERRRTREALQQREQQLAQAERIAQMGSWSWDVIRNDVHWSEGLYEIFGLPPLDFGATYEAYLDRVHPEDRAIVREGIQNALETGGSFAHENRIVRPDGAVRILHSRGETQTNDGGAVERMVGVCRDVTEAKHAEVALQESHERYRRIVETAYEGVWTIDAEGRTLYTNHRMADILGVTVDDLAQRSMWDFIDPIEQPTAARNMDRRRHGIPEVHEFRFRRPDGSEVWTLISASPIWNQRGEFAGALGMITDITDRKRAEAENLHLKEELERRVEERTRELATVNRELETFSYTVSHDLRAPVRAIEYLDEALLTDHGAKLDPEARWLVERIQDEAGRMGRLISDLLELSRASLSGLRKQTVDLSSIAREILDRLARMDPRRTVDVQIQEGVRAEADPELTRVLLDNLLRNAWKFTSNNPEARIEVGSVPQTEPGAPRAYYVKDNGIGFDVMEATHLFEPFVRLQSAKGFEGTGIGLATAKRVVERHGGTIKADAAPGAGATFTFTLG